LAEQGWRVTAHLRPGDVLATQAGTATLDAKTDTKRFARVHNLKVADYHTYYAFAGDSALLVHNCGGVGKLVDPKAPISRQGRSEMSGSQVKRLRKNMKANGFDPKKPIEAADVDGRLIIIDGHHRTKAAIGAGIKKVSVKVRKVNRDQGRQLLQEAVEARHN